MLLRFGCENFKSIGDYQEILFTSLLRKDDDDGYLLKPEGLNERVLPVVSIYGANGSGKTNILKALRFLREFIVKSGINDFEDSSIPKFKLIEKFSEKEQTFDVDFLLSGVHYHYGFAIMGDCISEEWLYSFSYGKRTSKTILFHRNSSEENEFHFGKGLKGKNKTIESITNKHSLFVSVAAKSNHELMTEIREYFIEKFGFRFSNELAEDSIGKKIEQYSVMEDIQQFLALVDIGSTEIVVEKEELDEKQLALVGNIRSAVSSALDITIDFPKDEHQYEIELKRKTDLGNTVGFRFNEESLGTRSLISLLVPVFWKLKHGGILVVDELESSLHTLLSKRLVELFSNERTNPKDAQLLFTTHETQLLKFDGSRRDNIWLVEKCMDGASNILPLSSYKIKKGSNLQNGYLDGRFGAIPFFGNLDKFEMFGGLTDEQTKN